MEGEDVRNVGAAVSVIDKQQRSPDTGIPTEKLIQSVVHEFLQQSIIRWPRPVHATSLRQRNSDLGNAGRRGLMSLCL